MKKQIFDLINDTRAYDWIMIVTITASLIPLCTKANPPAFQIIDWITCAVFIFDYLCRWVTADLGSGRSGARALLTYPLRPMAIIDLLTILPTFAPVSSAFKALRILRLIRVLRVFRFFRYSKNVQILAAVFRKQRQALLAVGCLAIGYIVLSALIMFQIEPDTFDDMYDALYWATVSLTTVGYGDIFATSDIGRLITMLSALVGVAIVALPAGIITAGYLDEIQKK